MQRVLIRKGNEGNVMDHIDVHDLPEEQARLVQRFVDFLREQGRKEEVLPDAERLEQDWASGAIASFAKDWDNESDAIYDDWREHYHVSEG